ncbi:2-hydroxyacid dehydrogenase [Spelaeicoccus albus]|uniref:D-3-phosphoglycerate dehydrogenase n=1 Tax=Spelaeicoccus albus TaxID=1280376 RepID=A0A7Z0A9F5_9MICO|nr:2-hydroxyacid dehydrogenase [Spelaeicoccus albus]NYI66000.1 D-3-phosphoglycerate dehydrogenase [Spelaeicoccus albus]
MRKILAVGDHFIDPDLFVDAIERATAGRHQLTIDRAKLEWPNVPFGPVDTVNEASGTVAEAIEAIGDAEIVATQMSPLTDEVFTACPNLKLVSVSRGGPVNVDLEAATRHGVVVTFAPGRNATGAAEFAIGLILDAMRRITVADAELKSGTWRGDYYAYDNAGIEVDGTTIGLVGYGAIGKIVAGVLRAFGAHVLAYDPYTDAEKLAADGVEAVAALDDLLRRSFVVSIHARLTDETHHLLNRDNLSLLPSGAILINMARGGLLDYSPLPDMLRSGQLGAVALDVYDEEPPGPSWPLFDAPNVITTPHLAGATRQTAHRAADIVAGEIAAYLDGERPRFVANPAVYDRQ